MKTILVKCNKCGKDIQKSKYEYDRRIRLGKNKFYCNNSCSSLDNEVLRKNVSFAKENPQSFLQVARKSEKYKKFYEKKKEEKKFQLFKEFVRRAKMRNVKSNKGCDITFEFLKELWFEQKAICPYSKRNMTLDESENTSPSTASLDRIDSSKGYIKGNVEFVCLSVNFAKSDFTKNQILEFFDTNSKENLIEYLI